MMRLSGKVALVTGGSGGIGLACAERLAADGARVFTAQRREAGSFETIAADLADPAEPERIIADIVARAGRLDVLVNNAGLIHEASAADMSFADWQRTLAVNLTAPFLLIKHALPHPRGGGAIVNIGSIEGLASNPRHPSLLRVKSRAAQAHARRRG